MTDDEAASLVPGDVVEVRFGKGWVHRRGWIRACVTTVEDHRACGSRDYRGNVVVHVVAAPPESGGVDRKLFRFASEVRTIEEPS